MPYAVGIYSTMVIPDAAVDELITKFKGERTEYGWSLTRSSSTIEIEPAHGEIPDALPIPKLRAITKELGAAPRSKLVVMWFTETEGDFEMRMARAVAKALSEQFTIVVDDNAGTVESMRPASFAGED